MAHPSAELQTTIVTALTSDPGILALLGGPKVFDRVPERVAFPYLTMGRTAVVDWSTGTEDGAEGWGRRARRSGRGDVQGVAAAVTGSALPRR